MNLFTIALVLELLGEIIIAVSVIRVHTKVLKEHRLDANVYQSIKREQFYVLIGIICILLGTILQIFTR